jgi:hypothetical protein
MFSFTSNEVTENRRILKVVIGERGNEVERKKSWTIRKQRANQQVLMVIGLLAATSKKSEE